MQKIDIESWLRKDHYWLFKDALIPHYQITLRLDITHFKRAMGSYAFLVKLLKSFGLTAYSVLADAFRGHGSS